MDPEFSLQDVRRCDVCNTTTVQSYCEFCYVNLCKPCIGEHISDEYEKHKIVPFRLRKSTPIYPKCETHQQNKCELQCKDCNLFVCSSCLASEQHKGHSFLEIFEVYKTKKQTIEKDFERLENLISPSYEEIVQDLEKQLASLDGGYEKLTSEISKHGEDLHREIDFVINKTKTEIIEIKVKHNNILQKHLNEIKKTTSFIKETLNALKEIKTCTQISTIIEYNSKIKEFSKLPPRINVCLPKFIKNPIDREKLNSFLGGITALFSGTEENVLTQREQNTAVGELLNEPELVGTIQTGYGNLRSVSYLNEDKIWTSGLANEIKCFNVKISLLQTMIPKAEKILNDIAVDKNGDLLYCDGVAGTVCRVKSDQTHEVIILLGWTPSKLSVTSTGDLLVNMFSIDQSKVVRYTESTEKQTIQFDEEGKPLYSGNDRIKYITENKNHDICVADWADGAVVVVNQDGKLKWRYTGHPSTAHNKPFKPYGITADSNCLILTADSDNHCVHILDQNGQFLRYIDNCDLKNPYGLCVDNSDMLFVCELYKGTVKKINYLK